MSDSQRYTPNQDEPIIKAEHVRMIFNIASEQLHSLKEYFIKIAKHELHFKEFIALDDISFEIYPGEVYGLVGTNGSGKSTMLKIIAGVLEPSSGTCYAKGVIAPLIELGAGFDMELTARENIYLNGALLGYSKQYITEHFNEIVDFAEIEDFLEMPLKNYSSGMVARIAFAIATVIVPDILIVDEALSVGDQFFQEKCEQRIKTLIDEFNVTVLFVSHSIEQVRRICERAIWIEQGQLRMVDSADKVCNTYGYRMEGVQVVLHEKSSPDAQTEEPGTADIDMVPDNPHLKYAVHTPSTHWRDYSDEGTRVTCYNEPVRQIIEAFKLNLVDQPYTGSIDYNINMYEKGWYADPSLSNVDNWAKDGKDVGVGGYRIEQLQILLTGEMAEHYDVYYRIYSVGFGWMDWKHNGDIAGLEPFVSTLKRERNRKRHTSKETA